MTRSHPDFTSNHGPVAYIGASSGRVAAEGKRAAQSSTGKEAKVAKVEVDPFTQAVCQACQVLFRSWLPCCNTSRRLVGMKRSG